MRKAAVLLVLIFATPVFADDAQKAPACGNTVTECAAKLQAQIDQLTAAYQAARQQRDIANQQLADLQLQNYIASQVKK